MADEKKEPDQSPTITVPVSSLMDAIKSEVADYFKWTPVEALALFEGEALAQNVLQRLQLKAHCVGGSPTIPPDRCPLGVSLDQSVDKP